MRASGRLGFEIVARNARVGRLELDVIARRGPLIVFCEVRSRSSDRLMTPAQSIDPRKVARVRAAAAQWLRATKPGTAQVRFDVASVLFAEPAGSSTTSKARSGPSRGASSASA